MFGYTKTKLKEFLFADKEQLTLKVMELMFSYEEERIMSFFRKTLSNMVEFWTKLDRNGLFEAEEWVGKSVIDELSKFLIYDISSVNDRIFLIKST